MKLNLCAVAAHVVWATAADAAALAPQGTFSLGDRHEQSFTLQRVEHRGVGDYAHVHKQLFVKSQAGEISRAAAHPDRDQRYTVATTPSQDRTWTLRDHSYAGIEQYYTRRSLPARYDQRPTTKENAAQWYAVATALFEANERGQRLPSVHHRPTIVNIAAMTSNAYTKEPDTGDWIELRSRFNSTDDFGWQDNGLRGHVFATDDNATVIISYKGTSLLGDTARKDKKEDNTLFSCCCARVSPIWHTVCDCFQDTYTCNATCIENELRGPKHYYRAAIDIYHNVRKTYPKSALWVVGHSLGGSVASLVAQTFGLPCVTFEAPGDKLAAKRLGLPIQPHDLPSMPDASIRGDRGDRGDDDHAGGNKTRSDRGFARNIWHIGHTADPIFMGTCNGITSSCWAAGFAMETHCHSGLEMVYDTVQDFGWRTGVATHRIINVISDVLLKYNATPPAVRTDECVDCFNWNV